MTPTTFRKGRCVNCDTPISTGILCKSCTPPPPPNAIDDREVKISEMKEGDVGFTEEYAIFEVDSKLYVLGSARISLQSEGYKTTRVLRRRNIYEVDSRTIDTADIFLGWPEMEEETDCFRAKLV